MVTFNVNLIEAVSPLFHGYHIFRYHKEAFLEFTEMQHGAKIREVYFLFLALIYLLSP